MARLGPTEYDSAVRAAFDAGAMARFSAATRERVRAASRRLDLPAKAYLRRPGEPERMGVVVRGLVRVMHITDEGQDLTVQWAHTGALVNALSLSASLDQRQFIQAVTEVVWCDIDVDNARRILESDAQTAWVALALAEQRMRDDIDEITLFAFGDLRTRVKRKLLEIACREPDARLVAPVTQEELASGVAAARPSVARVLGELRRAGAIRSTRAGIEILKPQALVKGGRRATAA